MHWFRLVLYTHCTLQLFDLVDLHLREALFPKEIAEHYPLLVQHHEVCGEPSCGIN